MNQPYYSAPPLSRGVGGIKPPYQGRIKPPFIKGGRGDQTPLIKVGANPPYQGGQGGSTPPYQGRIKPPLSRGAGGIKPPLSR